MKTYLKGKKSIIAWENKNYLINTPENLKNLYVYGRIGAEGLQTYRRNAKNRSGLREIFRVIIGEMNLEL